MNVNLRLFLRKTLRVIFDIFAPESYGSYLGLFLGFLLLLEYILPGFSFSLPIWTLLSWWQMPGKNKTKNRKTLTDRKVWCPCEWAWAKTTSSARILSLNWLGGNEDTSWWKLVWFYNGHWKWMPSLDFQKGKKKQGWHYALFFWFFLFSFPAINLSYF